MEPRRGQCCGFVQEQEVKGRSVQVLTISSSRLPFDRFDRCIYGFGRLVVLIFAYDQFFLANSDLPQRCRRIGNRYCRP